MAFCHFNSRCATSHASTRAQHIDEHYRCFKRNVHTSLNACIAIVQKTLAGVSSATAPELRDESDTAVCYPTYTPQQLMILSPDALNLKHVQALPHFLMHCASEIMPALPPTPPRPPIQ